MVLVPVKNFAASKQRLSSLLNPEQRRALARTMLQDVFQALAQLGGSTPVAVVTGDPKAQAMARSRGFEIIEDAENGGETDAIHMATELCASRKIKSTLVIPGDVPLVTVHELRTILDSAPREGAVLVPAADGRGTNAILRTPPNLFPARFGDDSFKPHLESARKTGTKVVVLRLPGIAVDVDNPEDLRTVLAAQHSTHTQQLLRSWENIVLAHHSAVACDA
jgi:2-phospho-L-lactate guanylyltransferase